MPLIQPLNQVPEEILQRYLTGSKSRELYETTYISSIRPDPRDLDNIVLVSVTVRDWAQDVREALQRLADHPQSAVIGSRYDTQELTILSIINCAPVGGNSGGGIDESSMLDVHGEIGEGGEITNIRKLNNPN